jgi:hypothetical protein
VTLRPYLETWTSGHMIKHSIDPFPHWVIDNFLPIEMAADAYTYFFDGEGKWIKRHHLYSRFKETRTEGLSWPVERALRYMESDVVRASIAASTKIGPLSADSVRFGGGQHVTYDRGRLGIHADFTHHPASGMRRALNLLVYLTKQGDAIGGALELWNKTMSERRAVIAPVFNRAVLFATSTTSYHGHPDPLRGERRSLACYYYVPAKVSQVIKVGSRSATHYAWIGAPPEEVLMEPCLRTTDYRPRPWEYGLRLRRRMRILLKGK